MSSSSSFRPGAVGRGRGLGVGSVPPKGYVAGLGRGAAGFTTRSDIGPMTSSATSGSGSGGDNEDWSAGGGSGSRSAELRAAKLAAQKAASPFGVAPKGYVAGAGRGAGGGGGGGGDMDGPTGLPDGEAGAGGGGGGGGGEGMGSGRFDEFGGYDQDSNLFGGTPYDNDDEEADKIYDAIDARMSARRSTSEASRAKKKKKKRSAEESQQSTSSLDPIGEQFRELKAQLADVTSDEWQGIPDVGESIKVKRQRKKEYGKSDVFTPLTDSLLESRSRQMTDATASGHRNLSATTGVDSGGTETSLTAAAGGGGGGYRPAVTNMSGLAEARGTMLGMSLDKMSDSVSGQTVVDPKGYLTSLSSVKIATNTEISDVNKARLLLKSVRDTNPKHAPGWIAAARVEESAGKIQAARKLIQDGCHACPDVEDIWLEAARLFPVDAAKTMVAAAVRRIPTSVRLFLKAADLEAQAADKRKLLRKALEAIPTSVTLWKAAIELEEDPEAARVLLSVAVDKVPHAVEMWLALARLESYENAKAVLNRARRALPAERAIWIAAAQLEEAAQQQGGGGGSVAETKKRVEHIIQQAMRSLERHEAVFRRSQWLKEAHDAEFAGAPLTAAALIQQMLGKDVDPQDLLRTWTDDAKAAEEAGAFVTARAILAQALANFPTKRALWMQAVELEKSRGPANFQALDEVLSAASQRLPKVQVFWLLRAKEHWMARGGDGGDGGEKNVNGARAILQEAFVANPNSESILLAAAKLEWENEEFERARVILQRARTSSGTARIYLKSALLERECRNFSRALQLVREGIAQHQGFAKLYMMGGQISSMDVQPPDLPGARKFYQAGIQACPDNATLWILASQLEVASNGGGGVTKARSLLELARLQNPATPSLWVAATRLERGAGNFKWAQSLLAQALQECPTSGLLLAESIRTCRTKAEQKAKSAHAISQAPDDALVICAVANLFAADAAAARKLVKARKWYERAVTLFPNEGDAWAFYLVLEWRHGSRQQQEAIVERAIRAEPKHGQVWCPIVKDMRHFRKSPREHLTLVATHIQTQQDLGLDVVGGEMTAPPPPPATTPASLTPPPPAEAEAEEKK